MRLGVVNPTVLTIPALNLPLGVQIGVDEVSVLQHFGEEEGFLEISGSTAVGSVHVGDRAVATANAGDVDDVFEAGEGPLRREKLYVSKPSTVDRSMIGGSDIRLGTCGLP